VNPPSIATSIAGVPLPGPFVLASGILGVSASSMAFAVVRGAGAVTTKSVAWEPRRGHANPVVAPFEHGLLNAVGLSGPGATFMAQEIAAFRERSDVPIIASVFGADPAEFARVTAEVAKAMPHLIEVNVSCPNVSSEFGVPFSADPVATGEITRAVVEAAGGIPVATKLSFHCPSLALMAKACEDAGASALTAINTIGPGIVIEPGFRRPVLTNTIGGVSGPAILPLAIKAVWDLRRACELPIIGTGGVETLDATLQMLMAGASAVGVGTGLWRRGAGLLAGLNSELQAWLEREGCTSVSEIIGVAHG
jgi:dihydroorotate dehydrogenase (NAD+) catalytic subunit